MQMSVSVLITCHNEERFVGQAIRSVVDQTAFDRVVEIIVVDDGSTDGSCSVLAALSGSVPRLRPFFIKNSGVPAARNFGIARSQGALIAILDGDDFWPPDKLERQLPEFEKCVEVGLVYGDFVDFPDGDPLNTQLISVRAFHADNEQTLAQYYVHDAPIIPSTVIIRRAAFDSVGLFDPSFRLGEDTEMWLRLAEKWRFSHVRGGLAYKRRHKDQMTHRLEALLPIAAEHTRIFAERNSELAPLVGKRMARRYARAGNDCAIKRERAKSWKYLLKALRLDPLYWRIYVYLLLLVFPANWIRKTAKSIYHFVVVQCRRLAA